MVIRGFVEESKGGRLKMNARRVSMGFRRDEGSLREVSVDERRMEHL